MRTSALTPVGIDRRRPGHHLALVGLGAARHEDAHALADLDTPQLGNRHRRDDLQARRIDDAQDHFARRRFDHVAGVVIAFGDDAVEPGTDDRARLHDRRRLARRLRLRQRRARLGQLPPRVLELLLRRDAMLARASSRRVDRGLGVLDARLRLLDFGPSCWRRRWPPTESRSGPADRRCARGRLRLSAARGCAPARGP